MLIQPNMPASPPNRNDKEWAMWLMDLIRNAGIYKGDEPPTDTSLIWLDTSD